MKHALLALGWVFVLGCQKDTGPQSEAETHWLDQCAADAECGGGLCVCGVCTVECAGDEICDEARPACAGARQMAAICGQAIAACVRDCDIADDCGAGDFECRAGTCVAVDAPGAIPAPDRGVPPDMDLPPDDGGPPDLDVVPDQDPPDAAPVPDQDPPDAAPVPDAGPPDVEIPEINLSAGGPYRASEGVPMGAFGTADVAIREWRWDLGDDGAIDAVGVPGIIEPPEQGQYPLVLLAEDFDGNVHVARTMVDVEDVDAVPDWHPPSAAWVGEPTAFPPANCEAQRGDPLVAVEVNPGDGFRPADGVMQHTWDVAGPAEIVLRCTDEDSTRDWPFPVDVRLRDRDGDGVEDALDACPDHPPPLACDGPCAAGFQLSDLPDIGEAAEADAETNARMVAALEALPLPDELRAPLLALAAISPAVVCLDGGLDCLTDGDDLELAELLFDALALPDLTPQDRRCVDAALDFRLSATERRMQFVCGPFTFASGGMRAIREQHPWPDAAGLTSRCHRAQLYNSCLVAALDQINDPRAVPDACDENTGFLVNNETYVVDVGELMLLPRQCGEDDPEVRWRVDWGDGSAPEFGGGAERPFRQWVEPGRFVVHLTCWMGNSIAGHRIEITVQ